MAQIGNSGLTGGAQDGPSTSDTYYGRLLEMPEDGTITSIYAMLQNVNITSNIQIAIYSVNGSDKANTKLYEEIKTNGVTTTESWCFVNLTTPLFLSSGTKFFAIARSNDDFKIRYTTGGLATEFHKRWGESYPTLQDPDTNTGNYYSGSEIPFIYVEYTPSSNPAYGQPRTIKGIQSISGIQSITF